MEKNTISNTNQINNHSSKRNIKSNNLYLIDIAGLNIFPSNLNPSKKASLIIKSHNLTILKKNKQKYLLQIHSNNNLRHCDICLDNAINQSERLANIKIPLLKKKIKG